VGMVRGSTAGGRAYNGAPAGILLFGEEGLIRAGAAPLFRIRVWTSAGSYAIRYTTGAY